MVKVAKGRPRYQPPKTGKGSRRARTFCRPRPGKGGAKPKWREENIELARNLVSQGHSDAEVAIFLGVSSCTVTKWKVKIPKFAKAFIRGEKLAQKAVERGLFQRATGMLVEDEKLFQYQGKIVRGKRLEYLPPDPGAAKTWLTGNMPEKYGDKLELSGNKARPVNFIIAGLHDAAPPKASERARKNERPSEAKDRAAA